MSYSHRQRVPQDDLAQVFERMQPRSQDAARHFLLEDALDAALSVYRKAMEEGVERYLDEPAIKPVFRKYN